MNTTLTDRIERSVIIRASRARVWKALTDAKEFGEWFGVNMEGSFVPGAKVRGRITTAGYEHLHMEIAVVKMEKDRVFSYRWHPAAIDSKVDYSHEPTTLVEFTLEDAAGGTKLSVVESGFDKVPPARRAEAFRLNSEGWEIQVGRIEGYVRAHP